MLRCRGAYRVAYFTGTISRRAHARRKKCLRQSAVEKEDRDPRRHSRCIVSQRMPGRQLPLFSVKSANLPECVSVQSSLATHANVLAMCWSKCPLAAHSLSLKIEVNERDHRY